jgi:hypothetical protein
MQAAYLECASSYDWVDYFYRNAREPSLPWHQERRLSGAERLAVIDSMRQFQLGEGASGTRMLKRAQRFSRATGDLGIIAALKLFLREEQRHSQMLAQFLRLENATCLREHWIDSVFRGLRGLAGLELCLKVLVTAEIIARPYYAALRDATDSPLLRSLSQLIFDEEAAHLRFQAFALSRFRHSKSVRRLLKGLHAALLAGTAMVCWIEHKAVFLSAGRTFSSFWREAWREFDWFYRAAPEPIIRI